jgi:hypothetical protein
MRTLLSIIALGLTWACGSTTPDPTTGKASGRAVDYAFAGIEGDAVSDERMSGRVTVLLFATTFDLDSQAQAKLLEDLYRTHTPRINAALVCLEAPQNVELVRGFRDVLHLSYAVSLADQEEIRSGAGFPAVRAVPTWIVLDRAGRVNAQHEGAVDSESRALLVKRAA